MQTYYFPPLDDYLISVCSETAQCSRLFFWNQIFFDRSNNVRRQWLVVDCRVRNNDDGEMMLWRHIIIIVVAQLLQSRAPATLDVFIVCRNTKLFYSVLCRNIFSPAGWARNYRHICVYIQARPLLWDIFPRLFTWWWLYRPYIPRENRLLRRQHAVYDTCTHTHTHTLQHHGRIYQCLDRLA